MCPYSHEVGKVGWKVWACHIYFVMNLVTSTVRLFETRRKVECWEVARTQDKVNIVWGYINILVAVVLTSLYVTVFKMDCRNLADPGRSRK